jgi:hypothetical protein
VGGIPIALPGLAVFVFLLFRALDLLLRRRAGDADEARFTVAATLLPLVVSVISFLISILHVGACASCASARTLPRLEPSSPRSWRTDKRRGVLAGDRSAYIA